MKEWSTKMAVIMFNSGNSEGSANSVLFVDG